MKAHLFTIWIAILLGGMSRAAEPTDFEKLQGVWRATLMEVDREVDPEATLDRVHILFERDLATLYQGGKRVGSYRFTLDSQTPVAEIDFASPEDPTPETSKQGIYRFRGESLELCLGPTRPTSFRGDTGADFLVFRRPAAEQITAVPAWCLDAAPSGNQLAIAGGERDGRGVVTLLNAEDWSIAFSHSEQRAATCVAYSPDGTRLAIGTQIGEVAIFDLKALSVENRWATGSSAVFGITWTPDNRDVIAACASGVIKRFSVDRGTLLRTFDTWQADGMADPNLRGHSDRNLWDVAVSRDGKTLLSGGWNGTTRLWNLTTGEMEQAFSEVDESTQGVQFTPDERHFLSNSIRGSGTLVRATDSREIRADLDAAGRDVAVHPDGELIAACTLESVRVFRLNLAEPTDAQQTECLELLAQLADADETNGLAIAENLRTLGLPVDRILQQASRTAEGSLRQRIDQIHSDIKSPAPIATLDGHEGEVRQVAFSPAGNFLATSTITGDIRLWNPQTFQLEHSLTLMLNP